ncbi:MAG: formimidoylglutamate deiminase [Emcibacteraceae bacterium]|nr:formimidoylglutamate deiminase [Emcibacteraceae bacterium]
MKRNIFSRAFLQGNWAENVCVEWDSNGLITKITPGYDGEGEIVTGYALPAMNNVHSHAFQRAMAGLAEYSTSANDSFWTWRDIMYRFAEKISASDLEGIAAQLYLEMLKAGYVSVVEFHYLHHSDEGSMAMSQAIINAATNTGIGLCHLPVLYMASGFGGLAINDKQKRFAHSLNDYLDLIKSLSLKMAGNNNQHLGMAFHSLRAVPEEALQECLSVNPASGPIHIHISEQTQEVSDCLDWSGKRPVQWLYDNFDVDDRWCLIHATHLNEDEIAAIAGSGAVVGLCPTTEANLGDGLFPLKKYMDRGGHIAIGSDSHISVSVTEELRLLEYGQRLKYQQGNIAANDQEIHTGTHLYQKTLTGGARASGFDNGAIEIGKRADIIVLDERSPLLTGSPNRNIIDRFIFSGNVNPVKHVYVRGEKVVSDYKHASEDRINDDYRAIMDRLKKVLD